MSSAIWSSARSLAVAFFAAATAVSGAAYAGEPSPTVDDAQLRAPFCTVEGGTPDVPRSIGLSARPYLLR